jgi:uncharacterized repeat protein (TIGR01451 family)
MTRRVRLALVMLVGGVTLAAPSDAGLRGQPGFRPDGIEPPLADDRRPPFQPPQLGTPQFGPQQIVDPPTPQVSLKVRVAATSQAGKELEYRLTVENTSDAAAHHVIVRNPLPANVKFVRAEPPPTAQEPELRWDLGTLAPRARKEVRLIVLPTGGDVRNTARVQFEHGQTVVTRLAKPDLALRLVGPTQALVNDIKAFTLELSNPGQAAASGVVLVLVLPDGLALTGAAEPPEAEGKPLTWELGGLRPGETRRVTCRILAKQAGAFVLKAEASDAAGLKKDASASVLVGEASLSLVKTGPARVYVEAPATYAITITNTGTTPATGVVLDDAIPNEIDFVGATQPYRWARQGGNRIVWELGALRPGERRTVQLTVRARRPGTLTNRATARADRDLKAEAEAVTVFEGATALTFVVEKSTPILEVGKPATYTVRVRNGGTAAATRIGLKVTLPPELRPTDARGPTMGRTEGQVVTFEPLANLAPKAEAAFTVAVQAVKPGQVRVHVEMTADQLSSPLRSEEGTHILADMPGPP